MKKKSIKVSTNLLNLISLNQGKIIAAVNGTFLSEVIHEIKSEDISESFIFWPDGILSALISRNLTKIPGRHLLDKLIYKCKNDNLKICFIGDPISSANKYLDSLEYENKKVSYGTPEEIYQEIDRIDENIIVINIPSPKQEILAIKLLNKYPESNIYCTGGALNMLIGNEEIIPTILYKLGFEWLWRLKTDTKRRAIRLKNIIKKLPKGYFIFLKKYYYEKF